MNHTVIIGGGASGLVAALTAKKENNLVTILEKNSFCGKKLLVTGNGKCNYWNADQDLSHYHSNNNEILKEIITPVTIQEVLSLFSNLGVYPKIKNGYYYPYSNQATTIKNVLLNEVESKHINIKTDFSVTNIIKKNNYFEITNGLETISATHVIIATGGMSAPKTGSTGDGYKFLQNFKHTLIKPLPALVQLQASAPFLKKWAGIRTDVKVSLYENSNFLKDEEGEIQLTDYGVSGICIFNLSRYVSRGLETNKKEQLLINFLPFINSNPTAYLDNFFKTKNSILNQLSGILNDKLVAIIISLSGIQKEKPYQDLTSTEKERLVTLLTAFPLELTGTNSFNESQVSTGGIPLSEINPHTMESKIVKNLYLTGEVLDVDGDCGGYNLGFAWISGMLAGKGCERDD